MSLRALYIGIPVAALVAGAWSVLVGTSSFSGNPSVTGRRAVLYDLPGTCLLVGVAATGLVLAAKALRARARGAELGFWLSAGALLLVLAFVTTTIADTLSTPSSATVNWVVRGGALVVTVAATTFARWWAHRRPPATGPARRSGG